MTYKTPADHVIRRTEMVRQVSEYGPVEKEGELYFSKVDWNPPDAPACRPEGYFECDCGDRFRDREDAKEHLLEVLENDDP